MKYLRLFAMLLMLPHLALADYPGDEEVIGKIATGTARRDESLMELARRHGVGFNAIAAANPALDPFVPEPGATVTIPTAWIVPASVEPGTVVVNLSELRLYYLLYRDDVSYVATFPIGIGSDQTATPAGNYRIVEKLVDPSWYVPSSVKKEHPELPAVVRPGPDNPLGSHALRLSRRAIMIHGTNKPWGVGRRVSHGCIRLYPEDIPRLYALVPEGTEVSVVREAIKVGVRRERVYIEVHRDAAFGKDYLVEAERLLASRWLLERIDPVKLRAAVREKKGLPVDISL